ncbi:HNH endonuclease [Methylocaldum szegediense]|uniref:HNH endonuclease n=1 Tax=Methylocaldum szegediense TaxID=73780 RepID=A0ABM9I2I2_9GAMM|nr:HNH endonuclease [Methylocaldum szegediense]CAI8849374.1 HNH endonuclease [Methylocaldum szegediense]
MDNRISIERLMEWVVPVTESGCWIWIGSVPADGERIDVEWESLHPDRFFWEIHYGHIPSGQCVCHKCNVQYCVNPNHLFLKASRAASSETA